MRRPASGGACLPRAALLNRDQHYNRLFVVKRRFYSNCYGHYFKCNSSIGHCCEQMQRAKTKQMGRLFIDTRTPKSAFSHNALTICASFLLILSCAILFFAINSSTITTVAAATNTMPSKIDENHNNDAPLHRHHNRRFDQRYSKDGHSFSGYHPNYHRSPNNDRPVLRHDQHHKSYRSHINNRHTRYTKDNQIDHQQSRRHPNHKLYHFSNPNLELDSSSLRNGAQERPRFDDTDLSQTNRRDLFRTAGAFNSFGRKLIADNNIDSYNVDDIFNDKDDPDFEPISDDFEDLDDDEDDGDDEDDNEFDDDDDDEDGDDDDDDEDNMGRLNEIDDDNRIQIDLESRPSYSRVHGKSRVESFDQRLRFHKSNRQPNLLKDQLELLKSVKKGDGTIKRHHASGKRNSIGHNHHRAKNYPLDEHSGNIFSHRTAPASTNDPSSRHIASSPHVPYQSPIVVSISDNSYVSASPIVTKGDNFDDSTEYFSKNNTSDSLTTSTTATTTSNSIFRNINSNGGNLLDLDNPVWREQPPVEKSGRTQIVSTDFKVSKVQPSIVFSNFNRNHYNSDLESHGTNIPIKRDRPEQRNDNEIQGIKYTTINDQSKNVDRIRTNMIVMTHSDVDGDEDDEHSAVENSDNRGVTTIGPTSSTSMQAHAYDIDLSIDDDLDDDKEEAKDLDNDSDGSESTSAVSLDVSGHAADPGANIADVHKSEGTTAKYSNMIIGPKNVLPSFGRGYWHNPHLASIQMVQEDPNELNQGGINSAIIAMLFGIGATGMLIMVVGLKMRTIRERVAYKGQRRSLVPDTDFLINTIPIRSDTFHSLDKQACPQS